MPRKTSAGLLFYRVRDGAIEVLLGHPGGPFWQNRDLGAWSIPKGEIHEGEEPLDAARREFREETGLEPGGPFLELMPIQQKGGKIVRAWAVAGDCDPSRLTSVSFEIEWPPRSGQKRAFPEIDRAQFFGVEEAKRRINSAQAAFIEELQQRVG